MLLTKWGGAKGTWKPFQDLVVTSASEIFFNSVLIPPGNITTTTNSAGGVEYKLALPDGSYALVNFQSNAGVGYFFDAPIKGWSLTGAYQPNSSASGQLDLHGIIAGSELPVPVKSPATTPVVTTGGPAGVSVKLVDSTGQGLSGASGEIRDRFAKAMGKTGVDGLATINAIPGTYTFALTYQGQTNVYGPVPVTSGSVVVFSTAPVEVALAGGAGQLPAATLEHRGEAGFWMADGALASSAPSTLQLLPGKYTFRASFRGQSNQMDVSIPNVNKLAFALVPTTIKLTGASGPMKAGNVAHRGNAPGWVSDGATAADGSVKVYLLAGAYTFSMDYRGQTNQQASVTIAEPAGLVEFPLVPVTVTVQTAQGEPVEGAAVAHRAIAGSWISDGMTSAKGTVSFDLLGAAYEVSAAKGGVTTTVQATVPPGTILIKR